VDEKLFIALASGDAEEGFLAKASKRVIVPLLTHTHSLSHSLSHTHTLSLTHIHTHAHPHSHTDNENNKNYKKTNKRWTESNNKKERPNVGVWIKCTSNALSKNNTIMSFK
jgi:hypothetical protein